ncbi:MAG: MFS transporter [Kineosporiaceae bacterium]|nr:MFS transporter [Aeromicrobium sp.]
MSAIASYRELMRIAGPAYIVVAFLGRIPLAMSQMGTLILVSSTTGRYALGGAAAGALAVANAIGAPLAGALADRIGQRPVVLVQSLAGACGLIALVVATHQGASAAAAIAIAAAAGFAMPQVGPLARVRWQPITRNANDQRRLIDAAFSYEGAADEASFVFGPALVGALAILVDPGGALVVGAIILAAFGSWFALHPTAELAHQQGKQHGLSGPLFTMAFIVLIFAQLFVGMIFGGTQTGAAVLATAQGQPGLAGLIHATLGIGSVVAGLAVAGLPERIGYEKRALVAALGLFVLSSPLLLVHSIGALIAVVMLLGFAVAPYMISNFAMAGHLVPPARVGAAMTMLAGATGVGYALGSSVAGRLADQGGATQPFAVTVTAAALALLLALIFRGTLAKAAKENS